MLKNYGIYGILESLEYVNILLGKYFLQPSNSGVCAYAHIMTC